MQLNIFDSINNHQVKDTAFYLNNSDALLKIAGLAYIDEFISAEEHQFLWQAINTETWLTDIKRRVQHYGWKYDYKARFIDYSMYLGELPMWAKPCAERLYHSGYLPQIPDQLIINEYKPGQGIANHVDCEPCFGATIISVSLGSCCVMDFINLKTKEKVEVLLKPRSLVIISEEARYKWSHGIAARKTDFFKGHRQERGLRISMTFRNVITNAA